MLRQVKRTREKDGGGSFAIVASRYNARYVDAMLRAAIAELKHAGAAKVDIVRVPGAFEIPVVAARLARESSNITHPASSIQHPASRIAHPESRIPNPAPLSAIICLGVIFQGQTSHAQHIGWGVTHALAQIQIQYGVPVIHGVFVFDKEEHAKVRCLRKKHNRGAEAALTALQMARVMKRR